MWGISIFGVTACMLDIEASLPFKIHTHVRELFAWDRLDKKELIEVMNEVYRNEWSLLQNLFYPQMKLENKTRVGAKYKKKYSEPQTPLERILASPDVSPDSKEKLRKLEQTLNPFELKKKHRN